MIYSKMTVPQVSMQHGVITIPKFEIILTANSSNKLKGAYIKNQRYYPMIRSSWRRNDELEIFVQAGKQLKEYFSGVRKNFDLEYEFPDVATYLQTKVWKHLTDIPYGMTMTYQEYAKKVSVVAAVRSVASAVGRNPIIIFVPCHRLKRTDGRIGGYAAGETLKQDLLRLESHYGTNMQYK
ncbi:methylated-DNA--[protein]-cysteine S-methyltransferase [Candidatus Sneabacter namystus]|uniref:Methylated-DNA--[protein]-cysteine S-methyltransferase n=1 Tax=Candidatus Sneabacter namystus TaxID=2601646 RepID=A0A5C0UIB5_9RICK|nr:methylated-DNA--[protein]-cysteine S-methyltransferase [Candidatus Sneabacter namystus]QEK39341.1 methylated-DNA--[protein]-cysteine S-methyltransferase [Candidatus Sneabacter namystus]